MNDDKADKEDRRKALDALAAITEEMDAYGALHGLKDAYPADMEGQDRRDFSAPRDAAGLISMIGAFDRATVGMPMPVWTATCPSWFDDIYWQAEDEISVGHVTWSTRSSAGAIADVIALIADPEVRGHSQALLAMMDRPMSRKAVEHALHPLFSEEVLWFARIATTAASAGRCFLTVQHSNGDTDVAYEVEGGHLLFWRGTELGEALEEGWRGGVLPDRSDAEVIC